MRIAHVVLSLDVGGQERLILNLSRAMRARGAEVSVVSLTEGGTLRPEFESVPIVDMARSDGFDWGLVFRLSKLFRSMRPDVVHTHNSAPLIYAGPAARLAGVKRLVHTKHGNNEYTFASLALTRAATQLVSAFVAVSPETAVVAGLRERPFSSRLHVIPNGIPLGSFFRDQDARRTIRQEFAIPEEAIVLGSVGRLVPEKNYPLLVRAAKPLLGENVRLLLVGEGAARDEIAREITPEIAPFVRLTGARRDIPALLSAFDVFALSSRTEGLPLVVPEAYACELPIVSTRVGGLPSVVPPDVGILVDSGDENGLTEALRALVADRERREKLGARAMAFAKEEFSIEETATRYEALYKA